jgi:hypothetical protein
MTERRRCGQGQRSFKVDKTALTISDLGPTTQPNAAGWYKTDVTKPLPDE